MGVHAEQQTYAEFDLNFVVNTYFPKKLKQADRFFP
jgi:hypothetical protein